MIGLPGVRTANALVNRSLSSHYTTIGPGCRHHVLSEGIALRSRLRQSDFCHTYFGVWNQCQHLEWSERILRPLRLKWCMYY